MMVTTTGVELGHVHFFGATAERAQTYAMLNCAPHMERGLVVNILSVDCWCESCEGYHRVTDRLADRHEHDHNGDAPPPLASEASKRH